MLLLVATCCRRHAHAPHEVTPWQDVREGLSKLSPIQPCYLRHSQLICGAAAGQSPWKRRLAPRPAHPHHRALLLRLAMDAEDGGVANGPAKGTQQDIEAGAAATEKGSVKPDKEELLQVCSSRLYGSTSSARD